MMFGLRVALSPLFAQQDGSGSPMFLVTMLGFAVTPSESNFLWCRRSDRPVKPLYEELKRRKILVRYMNYEGYGDGLRISIGSEEEVDRLLQELRQIL